MESRVSAPLMGNSGRERLFGLPPMAAAMLVQFLVWSLGPTLIFGNLHTDTLEAAYWGQEWALGYTKHPPIPSWLLDLTLHTNLQPIFALMALSQITVAISAYFIWKTARLYASEQTSALAVLLFMVSPAATIYAVQINHNSILTPFWTAATYFGLLYLEERRWRDAILLGLIAGLGMLTKYEILFVLATLLVLAMVIERFRPALFHPASYVCLLIFLVVISPHIWWLDANDWPSVSRALGTEKVNDLKMLNTSAVNLLVGFFTLFIIPGAILFSTMRQRADDDHTRGPSYRLIAALLGFTPMAVLILGAVATMQVIKPLWVLSLSSTVAVGLAILFPAGAAGSGLRVCQSARIASIMSAVIFVGFSLYLLIAGLIGKPLTAYSLNTKQLATSTVALWQKHSSRPLACVIIAERKVGPSGVLWLPGHPLILEGWRDPLPNDGCARTGAIAVIPSDAFDILAGFPKACRDLQSVEVPAVPEFGTPRMTVNLTYIPPADAPPCKTE